MNTKTKTPSWFVIWFLVVKSLFRSKKKMNFTQNTFGITPWKYFKVRFMYFFYHLPMDKLIWEYRLEQHKREEEGGFVFVSSGSHYAMFGIPMTAREQLTLLQRVAAMPDITIDETIF